MSGLRTERARIRRALREQAGWAVDLVSICDLTSDDRLKRWAAEERYRLADRMIKGYAIPRLPLTSRPRAARKGSK